MKRVRIMPGVLSLAVACLTALACVKGTVSDDPEAAGKSAAFSLKISIGKQDAPQGDTPADSDPEQMIRSVRVVLYDRNSGKSAYQWDLDATNIDSYGRITSFHGSDVSENPAAPTEASFVSTARAVKRGDYYLAVIVNPSQKIMEQTKQGMYVNQIQGALSDVTPDQFVGADGEIQMTNHQGLVEVRKDFDFWDSDFLAQANPVPVAVERSLAKVVVMSDNLTLPAGAEIANPAWNVDIMNKHTYWLRRMAEKADGTPEQYLDTDRENFYAEDPNFSGYSVNNAPDDVQKETLRLELPKHFAYITEAEVDAYPLTDQGEGAYVTENTMAADEQRRDVTTRVVLSCTYFPNGATDDAGHFYTYNGVAITASQMAGYAAEASSIPEQFAGLEDAISAMQGQGFNFSDPGAAYNTAFSFGGLNFYKEGRCFYTILIRHFDDVQKPAYMSYGRYGVVRNNVYQVKIKSIAGPGSPVFPDPNPDPDDLEDWLTVELKVVPWEEYTVQFDY